MTTATLLLVPAYALCLWDVLLTVSFPKHFVARLLPRNPSGTAVPAVAPGVSPANTNAGGTPVEAGGTPAPLPGQDIGNIVKMRPLMIACLLFVSANLWHKLCEVRREYASLPALELPGSRLVHMDSEIVYMYRALAKYLHTECDTFVTYPGINSLYFWTDRRPPTHLNSTGWGQLSHQQQEYILASLRKAPRPMLVVVAAEAQRWTSYTPPPIAPLVRCIREDCREVARFGRFIIFVPGKAGLAHRTNGIAVVKRTPSKN